MRRVCYTGYSPTQCADSRLPLAAPPLVREHRLYEADWLLRHYEFRVEELTTAEAPNLDLEIDSAKVPKMPRSCSSASNRVTKRIWWVVREDELGGGVDRDPPSRGDPPCRSRRPAEIRVRAR